MIRLFALLAAVLIFAPPARAQGDLYVVRDVPIEAAARSAAQARSRALGEGHVRALRRLLRRLTLPEDHHRLPGLAARPARALAVSFEPAREKTSRTRYIARLSVRFSPRKVRALLRQRAIAYSDVQARAALLIPLYQAPPDPPVLWENPNPWRAAWSERDLENIPTPLVLPVGDVTDIVALPARNAARLDRGGLLALAQRQGLDYVLLARARYEGGGAMGVEITPLFAADDSPAAPLAFVVTGPDDPQALARKAAATVLRLAADSWKRRMLIQHEETMRGLVEIRFASFAEWRAIRERLNRVPILEAQELHALGSRQALLEIAFRGRPEVFALALAQHGIAFSAQAEDPTPDRQNTWTMQLQK